MNLRRLIATLIAVAALAIPAAPVFALPACFCAVEDVGAVDFSDQASTADACRTTCDFPGSRYLIFATDYNQYPDKNTLCFNQEQCSRQDGILKTGSTNQPAECPTGMYYCYPNPATAKALTLQVAIGTTTSVLDIGKYVGAMYNYLLGIAFTVAVVMMMIGGVQYVVGASTGEIGKAKDRIRNAVAGFVLLLFAYLILFTVNPQLVSLQVPTLPKIRTITALTGQGCEELEAQGYTLEYDGKRECGTTAQVVKDGAGATVADGTTCDFTTCPSDTGCLRPPGGTPKCARCEELTAIGEGSPNTIQPSDEVCSSVVYPKQNWQNNEIDSKVCFFTHEADLVNLPQSAIAGTCAALTYSCNGMNDCRDYGTMIASNDNESACLNQIDPAIAGGLTLKDVCAQDPCNLGPSDSHCKLVNIEAGVLANVDLCVNSGYDPSVADSLQDNFGRPINASWGDSFSTFFEGVLSTAVCEAL